MVFVEMSNIGFEWDDHGLDTDFMKEFYTSLGM